MSYRRHTFLLLYLYNNSPSAIFIDKKTGYRNSPYVFVSQAKQEKNPTIIRRLGWSSIARVGCILNTREAIILKNGTEGKASLCWGGCDFSGVAIGIVDLGSVAEVSG